MVSSIADNGGRSCINASAVVVPRHGREIADALAKKLGPMRPQAADSPDARLSGFANPKMADYIDGAIDEGLKTPGATDVTEKYRGGSRREVFEGGTYLRATVVHCDSFDHPLANREFLCPYASVVEVPEGQGGCEGECGSVVRGYKYHECSRKRRSQSRQTQNGGARMVTCCPTSRGR
jgi:acyl-CoA reductase-like NAD-dependent aldehyde dehydrogenase